MCEQRFTKWGPDCMYDREVKLTHMYRTKVLVVYKINLACQFLKAFATHILDGGLLYMVLTVRFLRTKCGSNIYIQRPSSS